MPCTAATQLNSTPVIARDRLFILYTSNQSVSLNIKQISIFSLSLLVNIVLFIVESAKTGTATKTESQKIEANIYDAVVVQFCSQIFCCFLCTSIKRWN